jgi:hypothetical protein
MKNLIYYPNFESRDLNWLKFALIYLENFSPIIPDSGEGFISDLYRQLKNETDLLLIHQPDYNQGNRATKKAIDYVTKVIQNPHFYIDDLNSMNAVREWKNPENQTYTLCEEKFVDEWRRFCQENKFVQDSPYGLQISQNLGEVYMTFLAQEVAYEEEASPITDKKYLDDLSISIRTKNVTNDNKIEVAKSVIEHQLPLDFRHIDINEIIKIRNKPGFKTKQLAFHSELNKTYESIGKAIEPAKFIDSYNQTLNDWTGELTKYGIGAVTCGLSAYVLLQNDLATYPEYAKQILEAGLILMGGHTLVKNINKNMDRKYCRQYLTELKTMK